MVFCLFFAVVFSHPCSHHYLVSIFPIYLHQIVLRVRVYLLVSPINTTLSTNYLLYLYVNSTKTVEASLGLWQLPCLKLFQSENLTMSLWMHTIPVHLCGSTQLVYFIFPCCALDLFVCMSSVHSAPICVSHCVQYMEKPGVKKC